MRTVKIQPTDPGANTIDIAIPCHGILSMARFRYAASADVGNRQTRMALFTGAQENYGQSNTNNIAANGVVVSQFAHGDGNITVSPSTYNIARVPVEPAMVLRLNADGAFAGDRITLITVLIEVP